MRYLPWILFALSPLAAQTAGSCRIFPADHILNTPIDTLPVHPMSSTWVSTIGANTAFHGDFSHVGGGIPFVVVNNQAKVPVRFLYPDESDPGPYPFPPDAPVEQASDAHVLVVEQAECKLYETWLSSKNPDNSWTAGTGAIFDLRGYALRPAYWTSADAAGLPIQPLLIRYDEVQAGEIKHAIRFTAPQTKKEFVWPARHYASSLTEAKYPPMGARFRLKATFNDAGYDPQVRAIFRAMKKYGIILSDNGSPWYVTGVPDARWNMDIMNNAGLKKLKGSDFEAVDSSSLMIHPDSGQAKQPGNPPPPPPPGILSVTASASSVVSGQQVTFLVALTDLAPAGGTQVAVASSIPSVLNPPAQVTVAAGTLNAAIPVVASAVAVPTAVTVTATSAGTSKGATVTVTPAAASTTLRINSGGPAFTAGGVAWSADQYFTGGQTAATTRRIWNTPIPSLYQAQRTGAVKYTLPVTPGNFNLVLHFAEIESSRAGQRVFHVRVNGQQVLTNFDIVAETRIPFSALSKTFPLTVTANQILVEMLPVVGTPTVSGIEVTPR
jgi:hypothetical protein